jgi:hypothetical protein
MTRPRLDLIPPAADRQDCSQILQRGVWAPGSPTWLPGASIPAIGSQGGSVQGSFRSSYPPLIATGITKVHDVPRQAVVSQFGIESLQPRKSFCLPVARSIERLINLEVAVNQVVRNVILKCHVLGAIGAPVRESALQGARHLPRRHGGINVRASEVMGATEERLERSGFLAEPIGSGAHDSRPPPPVLILTWLAGSRRRTQ